MSGRPTCSGLGDLLLPHTVDIAIRAIRQSHPEATADEVVELLFVRGWDFPPPELRACVLRLAEADRGRVGDLVAVEQAAQVRRLSKVTPSSPPSDAGPPISQSAIYLRRETKRIRRVMRALLDVLQSPRRHQIFLMLDHAGLRSRSTRGETSSGSS